MPTARRSEATDTMTLRKVRVETERARVLVVDDHSEAAEAMAAYLDQEDFECRVATGGVESVEIATSWKPHIIAMDVSMPEMNGIQAAQMLRRNASTSQIAIIAFTALDKEEVKRQMGDQEFDAYCQKGNPPTALVSLMRQFLVRE